MNNLAMLDDAEGDYEGARVRMGEVVRLREADPSAGASAIAQAYNNLGLAEEACGDAKEARRAWERAVAVGEETVEAESARANLAGLLADLGDLEEAARVYADVLRRREERLGTEHPDAVAVRVNAAGVEYARGRLDRAATLLEGALVPWERAKGSGHPDVAALLGSLGAIYNDQGEWEDARSVLERAVAVWEGAGLAAHSEAATALNNLGMSHLRSGNADRARVWFSRAVAQRAGALHPSHPALVPFLLNAARAARLSGVGGAGEVERAVAIADATASRVLAVLSSAEQRVYAEVHLDPALREALLASRDALPPRAVLGALLGRRGLLVEGYRRRARLVEGGEGAHDLRRAAAAVARAARAGTPDVRVLERERERIERAVADAGGETVDPWRSAGLDGLVDRVGASGVLVHMATYGDEGRDDRLVAFVVSPDGVHRVELGLLPDAIAVCDRWRRHRRLERDVSAIRAAVWAPVEEHLRGCTRVWVSAPGRLARVPWTALGMDGGAAVAVTPSARDLLLSLRSPSTRPSHAAVVGGVAYGAGSHRAWEPLDGATAEARVAAEVLAQMGMDVQPLGGVEATPAAVVRALAGANVAHVATHGFLDTMPDTEPVGGSRGTEWPLPDRLVLAGRSPLATNGLALAGANASPAGELTAEEIAGHRLDGLRLLVLSACDTGYGADAAEDGGVGLFAAAHAAGVRAVLGSLWRVPDDATRALMEAFYGGIVAGQSPVRALADAQREVRATRGFEPVECWAGWAVSGDAFRPVFPLSE
jgi:tetratricopeptide (TPR) repeat protein